MPETELMHMAAAGDATALRAALKEGGCELEARDDEHGGTAFLWACIKGSAECMQLLVDAGCDTAAASSEGETGLDVAQRHGHEAVAQRLRRLLFERKADVECLTE